MTITLTLNSGSVSTDAGPFTVSGTTNGGLLVNMTTGSISRTQLTSGWSYDDTTDTITGGTIASTGTCTTTDTWSVTPSPTPTSTPIPPTPTAVVSYEYQLGPSKTGPNAHSTACTNVSMDPFEPVYAATDILANVVRFFTDSNLTIGYAGESETHAYHRTGGVADFTGTISPSGFVTDNTSCQ
jgi:hypothetical protein